MPLRLVTFTIPEGDSCSPAAVGLWVDDYIVPVVEAADACGGVDCDCRLGCWNSVAALLACDECLTAARAYATWFEQADEPDFTKLVWRSGQGVCGFGTEKQEAHVKEPAPRAEGVEQGEKE